ncbi:MAG TPA: amidase [Ramlibacter sp.]|uniref:amidase n=1 Tax=Ramlibacter sp. TaxID=1917967 RepID=UPI002BBA5FC5|nr:amidase [Ramlibacter sp.]HVZ43323.1 amidase [Ramlibacter sp.]
MKNDLPTTSDLPLTRLSAAQIASLVARGDCRAEEVLEQHIARIAEVNPRLNAMCAERFEAARAEAKAIDRKRVAGEPLGPLSGVPVTIKESLDLAGMASTFGIASRAQHRASADEVHVARLRAAGAIAMAKTNVAQGLLFYEAENPIHGRTVNPWNSERTCGGSSGGEAALIASGASPLGLGTDIGGSVRVPATFCGIASIKPTPGRCDDPGRFSVPVGQQAIPSQVGPMARRVEDLALALEVINGGRSPPSPGHALGDWRGVSLEGLRVACYADDGTFAPAPAVRRAVREAAGMLRAAGAQVSDWTPPDARHGMNLFYGILGGDGMALLRRRIGKGPKSPQLGQLMQLAGMPRGVIQVMRKVLRAVGQPSLAAGLEAFGFDTTAHYWELVEAQIEYRDRFTRALDTAPGGPFDVIVCPAMPLPALLHGTTKDLATCGAYACLYNLVGYPAGVVPVTRVRVGEEVGRAASKDVVQKLAREAEEASAGLPIGVQVVARPWQEHVALAAMAAVQDRAEYS